MEKKNVENHYNKIKQITATVISSEKLFNSFIISGRFLSPTS